MKFLFFVIFCHLFSYSDPELENLWARVSDLTRPSTQDYLLIENYLKCGKRPYLDLLKHSRNLMPLNLKKVCDWRLSLIEHFKFIGPKGEAPIFEIFELNIKEQTKKRCILLYASYNHLYPQKAKDTLDEIRRCGYSGHVLFRIGGFPNLKKGGLKLCFIPYAFKVAFLMEAKLLGYQQVLWLDTAMHPLNSLEAIFQYIERDGYFWTTVGMLSENSPFHLAQTSQFMGVDLKWHKEIPQIASALIGLDFSQPKAVKFLNTWYAETETVFPNINWFPEELCLAIVAWHLYLKPQIWFGNICCKKEEVFELFELDQRPGLQFYLDDVRALE